MSISHEATKYSTGSLNQAVRSKRFPRLDLMPAVPETVSKTATKLRTSLQPQKPVVGDPYGRTASSTELFEPSSDLSMLDLTDSDPDSPTRTRGKQRDHLSDPFLLTDTEDTSEPEVHEKSRQDPPAGTSKARMNLLSRWQQSSGVF